MSRGGDVPLYRYTECGLPSVWLVNGYRPHQTPYGEAVIVENVAGLHRAIAMNLIAHRARLTGGEFRFLRKELDLSQARLAAYFGNDAQSIAIWEKRGRVPKWADRLLRALYREYAEGNAHIRETVERLTDADREKSERRVFEDTGAGWIAKAA
jgi:putative transcriptional regulator